MEKWEKDFWTSRKEEYDNNNLVVDRGIAYTIGDENSKDSFRGFDGKSFTVHFYDDMSVPTTNLWFRGTIPEELLEQFPDNAQVEDV